MLDDDERVWAAYNINGRALVDWHLANQEMLDKRNNPKYEIEPTVHNYVEGEVSYNPTCLRIFMAEYPPKLKVFAGVGGVHREFGHGKIRDRWWALVNKALSQIPDRLPRFTEKALIYYRFHFPTEKADADQFAIKYITDLLAYKGIFVNDTFANVATLFSGILNPERPGTEVFVCEYRNLTELLSRLEKG